MALIFPLSPAIKCIFIVGRWFFQNPLLSLLVSSWNRVLLQLLKQLLLLGMWSLFLCSFRLSKFYSYMRWTAFCVHRNEIFPGPEDYITFELCEWRLLKIFNQLGYFFCNFYRATSPPSFALEVFVHCEGETRFRRLCQPFLYSHSSSNVLEVEVFTAICDHTWFNLSLLFRYLIVLIISIKLVHNYICDKFFFGVKIKPL